MLRGQIRVERVLGNLDLLRRRDFAAALVDDPDLDAVFEVLPRILRRLKTKKRLTLEVRLDLFFFDQRSLLVIIVAPVKGLVKIPMILARSTVIMVIRLLIDEIFNLSLSDGAAEIILGVELDVDHVAELVSA